MRTRTLLSLGGALLLAGGAFALATPAQAADNKATVSILHGVPGRDGRCLRQRQGVVEELQTQHPHRSAATPGRQLRPQGGQGWRRRHGDAVIEANNVKVPGGANITVAAHLSEAGRLR